MYMAIRVTDREKQRRLLECVGIFAPFAAAQVFFLEAVNVNIARVHDLDDNYSCRGYEKWVQKMLVDKASPVVFLVNSRLSTRISTPSDELVNGKNNVVLRRDHPAPSQWRVEFFWAFSTSFSQ